MRNKLSRNEAQVKIDKFFSRKEKFDPVYVGKIKRLAMAHNIRLGDYRKLFCKKCLSDLRDSKTRVKNGFRSIECGNCGWRGGWKV